MIPCSHFINPDPNGTEFAYILSTFNKSTNIHAPNYINYRINSSNFMKMYFIYACTMNFSLCFSYYINIFFALFFIFSLRDDLSIISNISDKCLLEFTFFYYHIYLCSHYSIFIFIVLYLFQILHLNLIYLFLLKKFFRILPNLIK